VGVPALFCAVTALDFERAVYSFQPSEPVRHSIENVHCTVDCITVFDCWTGGCLCPGLKLPIKKHAKLLRSSLAIGKITRVVKSKEKMNVWKVRKAFLTMCAAGGQLCFVAPKKYFSLSLNFQEMITLAERK